MEESSRSSSTAARGAKAMTCVGFAAEGGAVPPLRPVRGGVTLKTAPPPPRPTLVERLAVPPPPPMPAISAAEDAVAAEGSDEWLRPLVVAALDVTARGSRRHASNREVRRCAVAAADCAHASKSTGRANVSSSAAGGIGGPLLLLLALRRCGGSEGALEKWMPANASSPANASLGRCGGRHNSTAMVPHMSANRRSTTAANTSTGSAACRLEVVAAPPLGSL